MQVGNWLVDSVERRGELVRWGETKLAAVMKVKTKMEVVSATRSEGSRRFREEKEALVSGAMKTRKMMKTRKKNLEGQC